MAQINFSNLEKAKQLISDSSKLSNLINNYAEKTKNPSCDKHGLSFGGDDRFSVFSVKVFLCCYTGYYGNSGCSTFTSVDNATASRLLHRVLNRNMGKILQEMADEAKKEAELITVAAKAEVDEAYKFLSTIEHNDQDGARADKAPIDI